MFTTAYGLTVTRTGQYRTPNDYTGAVQELVTFHGNGRQEWVYADRIVTSNVNQEIGSCALCNAPANVSCKVSCN